MGKGETGAAEPPSPAGGGSSWPSIKPSAARRNSFRRRADSSNDEEGASRYKQANLISKMSFIDQVVEESISPVRGKDEAPKFHTPNLDHRVGIPLIQRRNRELSHILLTKVLVELQILIKILLDTLLFSPNLTNAQICPTPGKDLPAVVQLIKGCLKSEERVLKISMLTLEGRLARQQKSLKVRHVETE